MMITHSALKTRCSSRGKTIVFLLLIISTVACSVTGTDSKEELLLLLPQIQGWQPVYNAEYYNRTSLFDYMNGGAERYLDVSFQSIVVQRFSNTDEEVTVEIYRFGDTSDAEELYLENASGKKINLGYGGSYSKGYIVYWYKHHLVVIMTVSAAPDIENRLYAFGDTIYQKLQSIQ